MNKKRKLNFYISDRQALLIDKIQAKRLIENESRVFKRDVIAEIFRLGCQQMATENSIDWEETPTQSIDPSPDSPLAA
jgi:hypothetical protein